MDPDRPNSLDVLNRFSNEQLKLALEAYSSPVHSKTRTVPRLEMALKSFTEGQVPETFLVDWLANNLTQMFAESPLPELSWIIEVHLFRTCYEHPPADIDDELLNESIFQCGDYWKLNQR